MSIRLPQPPRDEKNLTEWAIWFETLWNYVRGTVRTTGDTAASIGSAETYRGVTALSAPRTLTLASASTMQDGDEVVIQDESGNAGTHTITIAADGVDTINGAASVTITTNYGRRRIIKRGTGTFFSA